MNNKMNRWYKSAMIIYIVLAALTIITVLAAWIMGSGGIPTKVYMFFENCEESYAQLTVAFFIVFGIILYIPVSVVLMILAIVNLNLQKTMVRNSRLSIVFVIINIIMIIALGILSAYSLLATLTGDSVSIMTVIIFGVINVYCVVTMIVYIIHIISLRKKAII